MKIIKNITEVDYYINDVSINIPANSFYSITPTEYGLWIDSDDLIIGLSSGDLVINDGVNDLGIAQGISFIQGNYPDPVGIKGSDGTQIGNIGDRLKTTSNIEFPSSGLPLNLNLDPGGRLRTSEIHTLGEFSFGNYLDCVGYFSKIETGSGTVELAENNDPSAKLTVSTSNGDVARLGTRRNFEYNKGHPQLIYFTGRFAEGETNLTQEYGYFDNSHGLFFRDKDDTFYVVRRTSVTGNTVDYEIAQSNWNVDTLNGSGDTNNPSGLEFDKTKETFYAIDFLWLGAFHVRYYIAIGNQAYLVHTEEYSNKIDVPYMDSGQAKIQGHIKTTGTISTSKSMYMTCAAVKSEGKEVHMGRIRNVDTRTTAVSLTTSPSIVAGIRLNSNFTAGSIKPVSFGIMPISGNSFVYYQIIYNATISNATWVQLDGIADGLNIVTTTPTYSGGKVLLSGYLAMGNKNQISTGLNLLIENDIYIGTDLSDISEPLIIVMQGTAGAGDVLFSGQYREYI